MSSAPFTAGHAALKPSPRLVVICFTNGMAPSLTSAIHSVVELIRSFMGPPTTSKIARPALSIPLVKLSQAPVPPERMLPAFLSTAPPALLTSSSRLAWTSGSLSMSVMTPDSGILPKMRSNTPALSPVPSLAVALFSSPSRPIASFVLPLASFVLIPNFANSSPASFVGDESVRNMFLSVVPALLPCSTSARPASRALYVSIEAPAVFATAPPSWMASKIASMLVELRSSVFAITSLTRCRFFASSSGSLDFRPNAPSDLAATSVAPARSISAAVARFSDTRSESTTCRAPTASRSADRGRPRR